MKNDTQPIDPLNVLTGVIFVGVIGGAACVVLAAILVVAERVWSSL